MNGNRENGNEVDGNRMGDNKVDGNRVDDDMRWMTIMQMVMR